MRTALIGAACSFLLSAGAHAQEVATLENLIAEGYEIKPHVQGVFMQKESKAYYCPFGDLLEEPALLYAAVCTAIRYR